MTSGSQSSAIRLSLLAVGFIGLASAGCISLQLEEPETAFDAPVLLRPAARSVVGARAEDLVAQTGNTVESVPLDTQLIRRVAQQSKKAVVSLYTRTKVPVRVRLFPLLPSFRVQLPGKGLGSGFLIHSSGYVLTNNHVIQGTEEIRALTRNGADFEVTVLARDPVFDLALLKVDAKKPFPVLPMGDSEDVGVGDQVIAIGNPLGLGHTVTAGIISQTGRNLSGISEDEGRYIQFIQTDTAINPGSSGGPLITLTGAWVGVNTAGIVEAQNIGFSVPSKQALEFLEEVLAGKGEWEAAY
jgi:serine protease Do